MEQARAIRRVSAVRKWYSGVKDRWEERFARQGHLFVLAMIIACAVEVVSDWNAMVFEIDDLRGELRTRAQNYASIIAKASLEPVLAYDPDGLDALTDGLFDDEEVAFVRFADHQGTTIYDRLRPEVERQFAEKSSIAFREHYAHQMTRDVNGILQDPDLLAMRMRSSRHKDFVQQWTTFVESAKALFRTPPPVHVAQRRGVVLYQDRLKAGDGGHDGTLTYVLAVITDDRGEQWGATLIAFSLDKQNAVVSKKLWKGTGMLVLLVALILVRTMMGRRDKIRAIDQKKRLGEAKEAIVMALPQEPLEAGSVVVSGSLDQAEETVDGLFWDRASVGTRVEIVAVDPVGEGHAVASTALHVLAVHRERTKTQPDEPIDARLAALGRAAASIPLGPRLAAIFMRIDTSTREFEAIEGPHGSIRVLTNDGAVIAPARHEIAGAPENVAGPLARVAGKIPQGGRLLLVASGMPEKGEPIEVAPVAELLGRWRGAEGETMQEATADAAAWARGKFARLVDSDLLVVVVEG